jgi:HSP20 family protein
VATHIFLQRADLERDLRRFVDWLDADGANAHEAVEYRPPVDIIETSEAIEIVADLPGVSRSSIRIIFTSGTLVITGQKRPPTCAHQDAAFHLAERGFGRFAWGVRLAMAIDAAQARAVFEAGELRVTLPRIEERRGGEIRIPIAPAS